MARTAENRASSREKMFFTRNRLAERWILFTTRRPSHTTFGMRAKSESKSTPWAACAAASLPEAMATLQSASFMARMSLTPSPVMATVWPDFCRACTRSCFCFGVTRPKTVYWQAAALRASSEARVPASTNFSASSMPARLATSETVSGLSPEMTLTLTPCSLK